ncbi:GntR family transcriptional regulator [Vibrio sp. 10N.286.52.B1]|uniref:GntR family transcriptional regulator n=1 Tax=Vibrio sp. 10N.286.52.B1 TaxID=3229712 RepID=UPI00355113A5
MKYVNIYRDFKNRIIEGQYQADQKLPDGITLAKQNGCSEVTIKKALDLLVKDGLLVRKRGAGTFVKKQVNHALFSHGKAEFSHLHGTMTNIKRGQDKLETSLLSYDIITCDDKIAQLLNIDVDDLVYKIKRLRTINDIPSTLEEFYMPLNRIPGLQRLHAEGSIYQFITERLRLVIHSSTITMTITRADEFLVQHLEVPEGEPLVNVTQVAYLDSGEIFEYSIVYHRSDDFSFTTNHIKSELVDCI